MTKETLSFEGRMVGPHLKMRFLKVPDSSFLDRNLQRNGIAVDQAAVGA